MKRLVLSASALALLSGIALAAPAQAGSYNHRHGNVTPRERVAIARSAAHLDVVKRHAIADGHVSSWERAKIRMAATRHNALVWRLRHN